MADRSRFEQSYMTFRLAVYPDYPQWTQLQDWNSGLLTLDGHIAGYASRVYAGGLRAADIPDLDELVSDVMSLRMSLDALQPAAEQDARLVSDYRAYIAALESLVVELSRLAQGESQVA